MIQTPASRAEAPELETLREQLLHLGLSQAAGVLGHELSEAVQHQRPPHRLLHQLLSQEIDHREERRIKAGLRWAGLPTGMTLENFDFGFQPAVDRRQIETLATCSFVAEAMSVLLLGPPGVGKTHLAVALGIAAIQRGFSVAFYRFDELLHQMRKDADVPVSRLRQKKYLKAAYLIVDEVGFDALNRADASLFFRLISHRYARSAIAITANKNVKE